MKHLFTLLSFFWASACISQTLKIVDADTKQPVPFATVLLLNNSDVVYGNYAAEDGVVALRALGFNTAEISCVGYKTVSIEKNNLKEQVLLYKDVIKLKEVTITKKVKAAKPVAIGFAKAKKSVGVMAMQGSEVVAFISNPDNAPKFIESFTFRGFTGRGYKFTFRIHFYKLDTNTHEPGEEIAHEDIVRYVDDKTKTVIETDVTNYNIVMPADGVYAGIEWLSCTDPDGVVAGVKDYSWYNSSVEYTNDENATTYCRDRLSNTAWVKTKAGHNAAFGIKVTGE